MINPASRPPRESPRCCEGSCGRLRVARLVANGLSVPFHGKAVSQAVRERFYGQRIGLDDGQPDRFKGQVVKFRFTLRNAKINSYWLE